MSGLRIVRSVCAAIAFATVAFGASEAAADSACHFGFRPNNGSTLYGTDGFVYFSVYAGPNCTGAYVGTYFMCSTGATSASCSSTTRFQRQDLIGLLGAIQRGAEAGREVVVNKGTCIGGSTLTCLSNLTFYVND